MEETPMKALITMIVALGLAVGFVAPTFAADKTPTTKADLREGQDEMGRRNKDLFKGQDVNTLTNTQGASAEAGASCFSVHRSTKAASRLQGPCGNSSAYWPSVLRYR